MTHSNRPAHEVQPEALLHVQHSMIDGLSQLAAYFGFPKVVGQLYGALLLSGRPLCLDDLVEQLDISKANVSMNIRTLENLGMVRQVWVKGGGGRRKYYEAETDFWEIIANILKGRELRDVDRAIDVMQNNIQQLEQFRTTYTGETPEALEQAELYIHRITEMKALFQFAQLLIGSVLARVDADGSAEMPAFTEVK